MSDPYRPAYYPSATENRSNYNDYPAQDQYGALIPQQRASNYPSSQALTPTDDYLEPDRDRPRHHHHRSSSRRSHRSKSRSRATGGDSSDYDYNSTTARSSKGSGRNRSQSRTKELGATAAGGAAGAWLGHEFGHNKLATVGGLVVGALGARELEKRHERHKSRDLDVPYSGGGDRRRRSSSGIIDQVRDKVSGFLEPESNNSGSGSGRRSRSHVGNTRSAGYDSESEVEYSSKRKGGSRRGSRSRRDDYD